MYLNCDPLTGILTERLNDKGIDPDQVPSILRLLTNAILSNPYTTHTEINRKLDYLGWQDIELDYRTYELISACLEAAGHRAMAAVS